MKNPTLDMLMRGVNTTESSNNYKAIGPRTRTGDRAYGISQVMGANVPDWTKQFYGQSLTPEQYLNTPEAQVAVTQGKLGEFLQKYKTPQDAASVWFSGRPLDRSVNASDGFLKTPEYIQRVMQAGGMPGSFNDARSFQATGTDEMANAVNQPPGAQSMSLGDQENQQPFNNIGSTLANMGASIASLDNRGTGIASLNASRVAGNLAAQENAREAQGGWKYAGQTQNGQGLMFQNSRGEIRVEPLNSQFAGQKDPESLRVLDALASDPQRLETYQKMHGTGGKEPMDDATSKFWANMVLEDPTSISKVPQANRPQVMKDFVQSAKDAGYSEKDVVQRSNDIKGNIVEDRKRSQIIAQVGSARPEFESAATNFVRSAEKVNNKFGNIPLDTLYNKTLTTLDPSSEEAVAINNMKIAQEGLTKGFVRAMSGSAAGNAHAEERMTKLFDPAMPLNMVKGGIGVLVRDVKNYDESARFARDNARARNAGKKIPHPELEDENAVLDRILGTNSQAKANNPTTGLPSVGKKTTINVVEIERVE
jgi:hypothetical protein